MRRVRTIPFLSKIPTLGMWARGMARRNHYHVYVIELSKDVLYEGRFKKANPDYDYGKPCVYVGMTVSDPGFCVCFLIRIIESAAAMTSTLYKWALARAGTSIVCI